MQRLFGLPMGTLTVLLVVALGIVLGVVGTLALRNRVLFKLGIRNVSRRRGRAAVIVLGLMLATAIVASALGTGDTMASTIRSSVLTSLGQTDELIALRGAQTSTQSVLGQPPDVGWFPEGDLNQVAAAVHGSSLVDGVAPSITEPIAVQDQTSRQTEAKVGLFASDPARLAGFGTMHRSDGSSTSLSELGPGQVFVNAKAVDKLNARPGDQVVVLAGGHTTQVTVKGVVGFDGTGTDGPAVLMPLAAAQQFLGHPGQIKYIMVSNAGDAVSGASHTDAVRALLAPTLDRLGLEAQPVKADGIKQADAQGASFMSLFTTFGTFTISAGILLIFLIFVMLAAERRSELGIARAVGTQRRHLVQMYLFEGVAYDLVAAAVGAVIGVGIAYGMVEVLAGALSTTGIEIRQSLQWRSVVVAYALGVLLTFAVVTISAWRVSVLNVVSAIRNIPDPRRRRRGARQWVGGAGVLLLGAVLAMSVASSKQGSMLLLGVSLLIVGAVWLARSAGLPERPVFTVGGLVLLVWLLLPFSVYRSIVPGLSIDFSTWVISGLLVVIGATWTLVYNADIVLTGAQSVFGRIRALAPVLKTSIANPLRNRFRTGAMLAMFTLVVFTLVVGTTTSNAFTQATNNEDTFGGGFQVRAQAAPTSPVPDMGTAVQHAPGIAPGTVTTVASQSYVPIKARQSGSGSATFEDYALRGLDQTFTSRTSFGFATMARGYSSARQVWAAVAADPSLAVVDAMVVPHRSNFSFAVRPAFGLQGLFAEDKAFNPVGVDVRDPQTGFVSHLTVIGVLKDTVPLTMGGISISQRGMAPFGARATPNVYYFALANGADPKATASQLESDFLANGLQADAISKILNDAVGASLTFQRIILGFMGLGLLIGVAALGVISARSVVERRQQIGVLRAIGFQRRMVQATFLLESSFVSLVSILIGTGLGLLTAYEVVADSATQPSWQGITFAVPWLYLLLIFGFVFLAALGATYLPARRAARIYPAAALRYQ